MPHRLKVLPLLAVFLLCACASLSAQTHEAERIARNEAEIAAIKSSLVRVEGKIDKLDDHFDDINVTAGTTLLSGDRLLELFIVLIIGGDKATYWFKRRNGTWESDQNGVSAKRAKA